MADEGDSNYEEFEAASDEQDTPVQGTGQDPTHSPLVQQREDIEDVARITYAEMAERSTIPMTVWRRNTHPSHWDQPFDINEATNLRQINTYFARQLQEYVWLNYSGKTLRDQFRADFRGWTIVHFEKVDNAFRREMDRLSRTDTQILTGDRSSVRLVRILTLDPPGPDPNTPFPQTQAQERISRTPPTNPANLPRITVTKPRTIIPTIERDEQRDTRPLRAETQPARTVPPGARTTQEIVAYPQIEMEPRSPTRPTFEYELPPTRRVESLPLEPAKISAFQKGWKSARNYTGKQYDILYDKARIFISFCRRLQIDETQYHAVFPDILSDRAEDFYINHIGPEKTWDQIYNLLDTHFNSKLNHSQYWTDWTTTTFVRTQRENPDKTLPEVLEIMLDKLQLVQRALGDGYQGEINLHTAVARACRGVKEFEHALMTQKGTCEALFADLRAPTLREQPTEPE
ncbi:hypothetical protein MAPG_01307 [Magnaporthiopsis poae ATCC 64411]|uniref:Uncharacterized protein n=1 Tax=Magnaporthiopsis poae (strain ATCC 64411 / 73-15) TaxID=644358 RepID=A0A0C4DNC6_MAGP6|nr:hypothetical protein MAPG_01307 [Magnaporthiopsis poae ATCC 64411]